MRAGTAGGMRQNYVRYGGMTNGRKESRRERGRESIAEGMKEGGTQRRVL